MRVEYYCNHCGKTVWRNSNKRWLNSFCEDTGKTTRLWRKRAAAVTGGEQNEGGE